MIISPLQMHVCMYVQLAYYARASVADKYYIVWRSPVILILMLSAQPTERRLAGMTPHVLELAASEFIR